MTLDEQIHATVRAAVEEANAPLLAALDRPPRLAYSVLEVAEMLGTSRDTVERLVKDGNLARVPGTGRAVLIPRRSVDRLIDEAEAAGDRATGAAAAQLARPA